MGVGNAKRRLQGGKTRAASPLLLNRIKSRRCPAYIAARAYRRPSLWRPKAGDFDPHCRHGGDRHRVRGEWPRRGRYRSAGGFHARGRAADRIDRSLRTYDGPDGIAVQRHCRRLGPAVAVALADSLGVSPRSFIVAVMMAGSAAFATPFGYQTNVIVYQMGGYRYMDFVRVGLPLNLLTFAVAVLAIRAFFPF